MRVVRTPTVLQLEDSECGAASLAMILAHFGKRVPLEELRVTCGVSRDGSNAADLLTAAEDYGLDGEGFSCDVDGLRSFAAPAIIFWQFRHFLVFEGFTPHGVQVNDPAGGRRTLSAAEFAAGFTGIALTFTPNSAFVRGGRTRAAWRLVADCVGGSRSAVAVVLACAVGLAAVSLVVPLELRIFVDDVLGNASRANLWPLLGVFCLALVVQAGLLELQSRIVARAQVNAVRRLAGTTIARVLQLPFQFFAQRSNGAIAYRISAVERIGEVVVQRLAFAAMDGITSLTLIAVLAALDLSLAAFMIVAGALDAACIVAIGNWRRNAAIAHREEESKMAGVLFSGVNLIETLKATASEDGYLARWAAVQARVFRSYQELSVPGAVLEGAIRASDIALLAAFLGVGWLRVTAGAISIGGLFAAVLVMQQIRVLVRRMASASDEVQQAAGDARLIDDVMRYPLTATNADPADQRPLEGGLTVHELTFGYARFAAPAISEITLAVEPGRHVALVGSSGSGKSTVAQLIAGLHTPWSGTIAFDGRARETVDRGVLAGGVAYVDQDIRLFSGTVRENIGMWNASIDGAAIEAAARDAAVHDVIIGRPGGYDAVLDENGRNFSGGERARIEIARALASNPRLVILDEATSALDPDTEETILRNLRARGCACLIIAHRLSTIRDSDEILVLAAGRITERGRHAALLEQNGHYAALVAAE